MTHVHLEQKGDRYRVRCIGHATGSPETCAAVSCLIYTLAGWVRVEESVQSAAYELGMYFKAVDKNLPLSDWLYADFSGFQTQL